MFDLQTPSPEKRVRSPAATQKAAAGSPEAMVPRQIEPLAADMAEIQPESFLDPLSSAQPAADFSVAAQNHYAPAKRSRPINLKPLGAVLGIAVLLALGITGAWYAWENFSGIELNTVMQPESYEEESGVADSVGKVNSLPQIEIRDPVSLSYFEFLEEQLESLRRTSAMADDLMSFQREYSALEHKYEKHLMACISAPPAAFEMRAPVGNRLNELRMEFSDVADQKLGELSPSEKERYDLLQSELKSKERQGYERILSAADQYLKYGHFKFPTPIRLQETEYQEVASHIQAYLAKIASVQAVEKTDQLSEELDVLADTVYGIAKKRCEAGGALYEDYRPEYFQEFEQAAKAAEEVLIRRLQEEGLLAGLLEVSVRKFRAAQLAYYLTCVGSSVDELERLMANPPPLAFD